MRRWLLLAVLPVVCGLAATQRGPAPEVHAAPAAAPGPAPAPATTPAAESATATAAESAAAPATESVLAAAPATAAASAAVVSAPDIPDCQPTPLTAVALAEALREGHIRRFGGPPHADRWACAWAHCAFEQDWGAEVYANNLGHVTARRATGRVCRRKLRERVARDPDRWELVDVWFHAFDTPEDGAHAYWSLLASNYYSVLVHCDDADARSAARRLAANGYFTGPEEPYVDGMARLFVNARGVIIPRLMAGPSDQTSR
ncbi:MAG: hypothetical protein IT372_25385 [Polyangiaceae bacterium]|nr:hypothetical protein [Polyangiaceae bacterium]